MRAVVFHGVGDIRLEDVPEPRIQEPNDAIIRVTSSAICGTDLHMVRGTMAGMRPGTILGHEAVGVVEELGPNVRNLREGERVVVCPTIACGYCSYCRAGYYSQCDNANPNGPQSGTAFFGGPKETGPFDGLQAEKARIPYANVGLVKLPDEVVDEQAILIADVFATGYFGADVADLHPGATVAVFGCGPVGQFAIASAMMLGAGRVFAMDSVPTRLDMARAQGAEVVNFDTEDPVQTIRELTGGIGVDRAIDAVGVDANYPSQGPGLAEAQQERAEFDRELQQVAPETRPQGESWHPGDAPSQALQWEIQALAKAGTLSIVGVYPPSMRSFPIGMAMNRNVKIHMGNCPHRRYIPELVELVRSGAFDPTLVLTQEEPAKYAIDAYKAFDRRMPGWVKVDLSPVTA